MYAGLNRPFASLAIVALLACASPVVSFADIVFAQTNLTSDIPDLAANTDPNMKNPWGVSFNQTSPFWVSDQATGVSTLYNASGVPQPVTPTPLIVSTPGGATGQVNNGTTSFAVNGGAPASFIFSTLSGNIEAWNGAQGTTAFIEHTTPGGSYTGLTTGTFNGSPALYAANKGSGKIDVFDGSFNPVSLSSSAFNDPAVPAGLTPYNIQLVGNNLWVEYSGARLAPGGFVAEFDQNGNFIRDINDPHLNAPWGVVQAPAGFGDFGGELLVGNFNDGEINAFNPLTGAFLGTLTEPGGAAFSEPGLWALEFRNTSNPNGNTGNSPTSLYFVAGIAGPGTIEQHGLFGKLDPVPEPATVGSVGLILLTGFSYRLLRRSRS